MKDYIKPTFEFMELKPEEWLKNNGSGGGGYQQKCNGNDWASPYAADPAINGCNQF